MRHWLLLLLLAGLGSLGVLTLRSVAPSLASLQLQYLVIGLVIVWVFSKYPYTEILKWRWLAYAGLCILLVVPLLIGKTTRGIAAWIDIGTWFSIQPSQFAVPIVGMVVGAQLAARSDSWKSWLQIAVTGAIPAILILLEPDLGTLIVYLASLGTMVFLSHIKWQWLATIAIVGLLVIAASWLWWLKPYQKNRITSFLSGANSSGASYNAQQAVIAVGSGTWLGRGLGQGVQSHLRFLPERQTDFIFASLAEELGFLGSMVVLIGYSVLLITIHHVTKQSTHPAAQYFGLAASSMLVTQIGINIGMNIGVVPITGITLPFISYGGSSWLGMSLLVGLVQSIWSWSKRPANLHLT